MNLSQEPLFI